MTLFKKIALMSVLVGLLAVVPSFGKAATVAELQTQIDALMKQIQVLQQQLAQTPGGSTAAAWCHAFDTNLKIGDSSREVTALHQALFKEGLAGSDLDGGTGAGVGDRYGEETASAVTGFQEKYEKEILTPVGLSHGTGYVGKATRTKLNKLYGCGNVVLPPVTGTISIRTSSNLTGVVGQYFQATFEASGGQAPYSFSWAKGDMPPGLALVSPPQPLYSTLSGVACYIDPTTNVSTCPTYNQTSVWLQGTPTTAGTYRISFDAKDKNGNMGYGAFTIVIAEGKSGQLSIEGVTSVGVGQTVELQALYQPAMPACNISGIACPQVMPARFPVQATWTSSNPKVASVVYKNTCPVGAYCFAGPDLLTAVVSGVNVGTVDINALYNSPYGTDKVMSATAKVTVGSGSTTSSLTVLSPNGGEALQSGSSYAVRWSSSNVSTNALVNVWLLDNPTRLGSMVLSRVPNAGSANWIVAPLSTLTNPKTGQLVTPSGDYVIWIECADHNCTVDDSNAPFGIVAASSASFRVYSFTGVKPEYKQGNTIDFETAASLTINSGVTETSAGPNEGFAVEVLVTNQNEDFIYGNKIFTNTNGEYKAGHWYLQATAPVSPGSYKLKVTHFCARDEATCAKLFGQGAKKTVSQAFTVAGVVSPSITVLSPNGGETWQIGSTQTIKWVTKNILSPNDKITIYIVPNDDLSKNINLAQQIPNTGSYSYVVDDPAKFSYRSPWYKAGGQFKIFVCAQAVGNNDLCSYAVDYSDAPFGIVAGTTAENKLSVTLVSGNKTSYTAGEKISLSIKGVELFDGSPGEPGEGFNVQVYLRSLTDGYSLQGYNATYNKQTGYWDVQLTAPADTAKTYQIDSTFYCSNGSLACGKRYASGPTEGKGQVTVTFTFQIAGSGKQPVTVVSPNGGEVYQVGQTAQMPIKWTADCKYMSFSIALVKGGTVVQMINDSVPAGICSAGQLAVPYYTTWSIPKTLSAGSDYKLLINGSVGDGSGVGDDSNAPFSILAGTGASDASDLSNLASALNNIQASVAAIAEALRSLIISQ